MRAVACPDCDLLHARDRVLEKAPAFGTASEESLLMQQLTLLSAEQNLKDTQGQLIQSSVTLVMNLGGGWQWDSAKQAP